MAADQQTIFLITPRLGGLANDLLIQTESKQVLYHVRTKPFSPLGRQYLVSDAANKLILSSEEDHTVVFPSHTILRDQRKIAKVGQLGVIPQHYYIDIENSPRLIIRIPIFSGIFNVESPTGTVAEIAQHRSTWIVAITTDPNHLLKVMLLAIIYREYSIGG